MARKSKNQDRSEPQTVVGDLEEMVEEEAQTVSEEPLDAVAKLQQEIESARVEAGKNWDLYLRERADMENLRKRHQRDKEEALRFANDRLLREMIPVLDNLERAVDHAYQSETDNPSLLEGVNMTINQFRKALEDFGVKAISAIGAEFDPNLHQAMGHIESTEQAPNTVVTEFQKGYLLHDRLLRPALVMVAKKPSPGVSDSAEGENTETDA